MRFDLKSLLLKNSLVVRGGFALASISLIALLNMVLSVYVAHHTQGDASAINSAGMLRMQGYRIGYLLERAETSQKQIQQEIAQMDERFQCRELAFLSSGERAIQSIQAPARFAKLRSDWRDKIRPVLADASLSPDQRRELYGQQVFDFVDTANKLVVDLQENTENKILMQRIIQGISMALTVIVVLWALYSFQTRLVIPLQKLGAAAREVSRGRRSVQVDIEQNDELGRLASAFNLMAVEITNHYSQLEKKVEEKTTELQRSNKSLELVYKITSKLSEDLHSKEHITSIMQELEAAAGVPHVSICLNENTRERPFNPIYSSETESHESCTETNCDNCILHSIQQVTTGWNVTAPSFPIRRNQDSFGILFVELHPHQKLEQWQIQLFQTVADRVSTAFSLAKRAEQESRFMLLEERNTIARELHDSLAQSLSYLKFQIGRLQQLQKKQKSPEEQEKVIIEMKDAVNHAYGNLRELLTTFRLKINEPGLEQALRGTVAEFSQRGEVDIQLDYGLRYYRLTPNEEIHLLQIVRESLSNVVRHAKASKATVALHASNDGDLTLTIDDNGVGLQQSASKLHHYGLAIMNERARNLDGEISYQQSPLGGVRVLMNCQLDLYKTSTAQVST
ncbi:Nitrate/nitrite sensor kinase [gamma proteobacterium HdN1]|nr:Nitrate/nitrite sensor kinase [gamma proteobacterium HdN1]